MVWVQQQTKAEKKRLLVEAKAEQERLMAEAVAEAMA